MFEMFQYDFMQNALLVGTVVAVVAAAVGYFVVLRGMSFAAHALAHVGFAGAAGILDDNAHAVAAIIVVEIAQDPDAGMMHFHDGRNAFGCTNP